MIPAHNLNGIFVLFHSSAVECGALNIENQPAPGFDALPDSRRSEAFRMNEKGWTGQMKNIEAFLKSDLKLLITLSAGEPHSITSLADNSKLSRQAIRKHLRILEDVGMVHGVRRGRENHFQFDPKPIEKIKLSLDNISRQWDQALSRLKSFVEEDSR